MKDDRKDEGGGRRDEGGRMREGGVKGSVRVIFGYSNHSYYNTTVLK